MATFRFCLLAALGAFALSGNPATARECTTLYYSVNDYGKEGPSRDAQNLLDKLVVKWAADKGLKKYKAGKKDVECDLFLDFGVFDEYTCKATTKVCW